MVANYGEAVADIIHGIWMADLWGRMGWADIRRRYRRTLIGPFWSSLSLAILVVSMGIVWANLWKIDPKTYLPYLSSGMIVWVLFSSFVSEGCSVFVTAEAIIKQLRVPYLMLVCILIWRNVIVFGHNLVIYVPIFFYGGLSLSWHMLLILPGLVALCLNGVWISLVLGLLCARYRDIQQVVTSLLQVSMFITPIFWSPDQLSGRAAILVDYNLLYHYIEIVRDPLLGKPPSSWSWMMVLIATFVGWSAALYMFSRFRQRIPYWL
jgi:ABC-type polysaccharide/polyol phosphate export permease